MNIQVYADNMKVEAERDTMNVYLENVDLNLLVGQINTKELLEAIKENDNFSEIADFVTKELEGEDE